MPSVWCLTPALQRLAALVCAGLFLVAASGAEFRAALAVRSITPDPLLPVSGGVGPSHPTTRKAGELTVRALVLDKAPARLAIVSVDVLGFPSVLGNKVRRMVQSVPGTNILIAATHTHSAPDCYGFPNGQGGFAIDLAYTDRICGQIAAAIEEAAQKLQPVQVKLATGEAAGKIAYNAYAEQLYDRRCHVIQFLQGQQVLITLVNYAIHPEVLGADQGILSPDLVGPLYDRIASQGGGTGIFINSAQGGMVTADCRDAQGKSVRTWEECLRIGRLLADEALRIARPAPVQPDPALACQSQTISFPVESPALLAVLRSSPLGYASSDNQVQTQLNLITLGTAQILTIPGEALPNIGFYLKRKMRGEHNLLFGLTNDGFGYILTKEDWSSFPIYNYVSRICLGERTGEILVQESLKLIETAQQDRAR